MNRQAEIKIEKDICAKLLTELLDAGYSLGVYDGEATVIKNSRNMTDLMDAVFSTDEDILLVYRDDKKVGWVHLIWGNGTDIISDYSKNVDPQIAAVERFFNI